MSLRIITIDPAAESHWDLAKRNGFWELVARSTQLSPGDDVIFMTTGAEGHAVGTAVIDSDVVARPAGDQHRWSAGDPRRDQYRYRVGLSAFRDLTPVRLSFDDLKEAGMPPRLNPVNVIPDEGRSQIEALIQVTLDEQARAQRVIADADQLAAGDIVDPLVPVEIGDQRDRVPASVVLRRGQSRFRRALLEAYGRRCAVTGSEVETVLEAAHIRRYQGDHTDVLSNGLLLRSDVHTLFDCHRLTVTPDFTVHVAPEALSTPYAELHGQRLQVVPRSPGDRPAGALLEEHNEACRTWLS